METRPRGEKKGSLASTLHVWTKWLHPAEGGLEAVSAANKLDAVAVAVERSARSCTMQRIAILIGRELILERKGKRELRVGTRKQEFGS